MIWHGLRQASTTTITRFYVCKSENLQGGRYILRCPMAVTLKSMIYCFKIEVSRQCMNIGRQNVELRNFFCDSQEPNVPQTRLSSLANRYENYFVRELSVTKLSNNSHV